MKQQDRETASWSDLYRSGHFASVVLLSFGVWLHAADELMVSTITPALIGEIGGERYVAWLISLYEVGSIVSGALSALVVLRFGIRNSMACAALIYLTGCVISGIAPSILEMLAGRLIQGLGGGAMIAVSFVAVHRLIPEALTTRVFALISVVWGVSAFSGPLIGALFADLGIWRGAFFLFAIQALALALVVMRYFEREAASVAGVDARGGVRLALRILILGAGIVLVAASGTRQIAIEQATLAAAGFALLGLFVFLDGSSGNNRILPARPLNIYQPQGAMMMMVVFMSISTMGLITYGPIFMTRFHGMSASAVGIVLLLESVGWSLGAVGVASLEGKWQDRAIMFGFTSVALSLAILYFAMVSGPIPFIALSAFVQGTGFGVAWTFLIKRADRLAGPGERERIASAIPTLQRFGYALGAAFTGIIANSSGFAEAGDISTVETAANRIFLLSLIPVCLGLLAMLRFLSFAVPAKKETARQGPPPPSPDNIQIT
ncbi:MAG: MFS transporter [Rhizobiaceae bacterium]